MVGARRAGIEPVLIDRHGRSDTPLGADTDTDTVATIHDLGGLLDLLGVQRPVALQEAGT